MFGSLDTPLPTFPNIRNSLNAKRFLLVYPNLCVSTRKFYFGGRCDSYSWIWLIFINFILYKVISPWDKDRALDIHSLIRTANAAPFMLHHYPRCITNDRFIWRHCVKIEISQQKYKGVWLEVVFPLTLPSTEENTLKI